MLLLQFQKRSTTCRTTSYNHGITLSFCIYFGTFINIQNWVLPNQCCWWIEKQNSHNNALLLIKFRNQIIYIGSRAVDSKQCIQSTLLIQSKEIPLIIVLPVPGIHRWVLYTIVSLSRFIHVLSSNFNSIQEIRHCQILWRYLLLQTISNNW